MDMLLTPPSAAAIRPASHDVSSPRPESMQLGDQSTIHDCPGQVAGPWLSTGHSKSLRAGACAAERSCILGEGLVPAAKLASRCACLCHDSCSKAALSRREPPLQHGSWEQHGT